MAEKVGAYGTGSKTSDTGFRKNWDTAKYAAIAKEKDEAIAERAIEFSKTGKRGPRRDDLPKPTELMKAREAPLNLDKNLNKTMIVTGTGRGAGQPGFYCDVCNRTSKDSVAYLDHINSRSHLRQLGQTTRVIRSSLNDVRMKIAELRASTAASAESKQYNFDLRIKEIKQMEMDTRTANKEAKKKKKLDSKKAEEKVLVGEDIEMNAMMGFAQFG